MAGATILDGAWDGSRVGCAFRSKPIGTPGVGIAGVPPAVFAPSPMGTSRPAITDEAFNQEAADGGLRSVAAGWA